MSKTEIIKKHLQEVGPITGWQALRLYDVNKLANCIFRIEKDGATITKKRITLENPLGYEVSHIEYTLTDS